MGWVPRQPGKYSTYVDEENAWAKIDWYLANQPVQTPSTHRQRLPSRDEPTLRVGLGSLQSNSVPGTPMPRRSPSDRPPLGSLNGNSFVGPGFSGYGMSAGLKVSNPATTTANGLVNPITRSRGIASANHFKSHNADTFTVAQRPLSGFSANYNPGYGPPTGNTSNIFSNREGYS